ncbi:hypothetical protein ACFHW2_34530 [Actinomadura sp. LOL_016]
MTDGFGAAGVCGQRLGADPVALAVLRQLIDATYSKIRIYALVSPM